MEELPIGASAHLIHHSWLQVDENSTGHVLACPGLAEEGVESVVAASNGLVTWHLSVRLNAMLQAEQFPTRIANLDAGLTEVDAEDLTHFDRKGWDTRNCCVM